MKNDKFSLYTFKQSVIIKSCLKERRNGCPEQFEEKQLSEMLQNTASGQK